MPSDASGNTLVCELRFPTRLAVLFGAGTAAAVAAALVLPGPWWGRLAAASVLVIYASVSGYRWWRCLPARLVITGDGRCRGVARDGTAERYGTVRGGIVRRSFVLLETTGEGRRRLVVTADMLEPPDYRRLRARLRTAVAP